MTSKRHEAQEANEAKRDPASFYFDPNCDGDPRMVCGCDNCTPYEDINEANEAMLANEAQEARENEELERLRLKTLAAVDAKRHEAGSRAATIEARLNMARIQREARPSLGSRLRSFLDEHEHEHEAINEATHEAINEALDKVNEAINEARITINEALRID